MALRSNEILLKQLHPYLFVLKEGKSIKDNFLDYSLLMLQITNPEVISSPPPQNETEDSTSPLQEYTQTT